VSYSTSLYAAAGCRATPTKKYSRCWAGLAESSPLSFAGRSGVGEPAWLAKFFNLGERTVPIQEGRLLPLRVLHVAVA
jgi:hypothetical protein